MKQLNLFNKEEQNNMKTSDKFVTQGLKTAIISPKSFIAYNRALTKEEIGVLIKSMIETENIKWSN